MKNIIFTIAAFLLFAAAAFAQGSVEGTITDAKGKGVANVSVTIVGADGKPVATVETDEDGAYTFEGIAAGKYKIATYGAKGYKSAFRDDVVVSDDETTTVDIMLTPAKDDKPQVDTPPQPPVPAESGLWIKVINGSKSAQNIIATVTYEQSGNAITRKKEGVTTYVFTIPDDAANIHLSVEVAGVNEGTVWPIFSKALTRSDLNKCYKTGADPRDKSWSNDCQ